MNKLSCGIVVLSLSLMGPAAALELGKLPTWSGNAADIDGGNSHASTDKIGGQLNRIDGNINTIATQVDANTNDIAGMKQDVQQAKDLSTQAMATAGQALDVVSKVETNVNEIQKTVDGVQKQVTNVVGKVDDAFTQSKEAKELSQRTAQDFNTLDSKVTEYQNTTTNNVTTYQNQTTERVNQFEQKVNTDMNNYQVAIDGRVNTIQNEVGEVRESIQGAINDSANALIKSNNAELIANQANLTAQRAEDGLAQEIVDRKADVERGVREANAYTDSKFKDFSNQIEQTKKFAAAGTAAALAASQIPQVSQGSAFSLGLGMGNYSGQSALSIGMSARLGDYTVTKVAFTSDTQNNVGAGMAIAVEW